MYFTCPYGKAKTSKHEMRWFWVAGLSYKEQGNIEPTKLNSRPSSCPVEEVKE